MSVTSTLYKLQQLDTQIDQLEKRLHEIDVQLGQNEAIRAAQTSLGEAEDKYQQWKIRLTDLQLERKRLREERQTAHDRLYSGQIHNPREMSELQDKITEFDRRLENLEEPVLEAMYGVDDGDEAVKAAQAHLAQVTEEHAQQNSDLASEREKLSHDLDEINEKADALREELDAETLTLYTQLRQRSPIAVAALKKGECQVCLSQVITSVAQQARRGQIVNCPTCGRIFHSI